MGQVLSRSLLSWGGFENIPGKGQSVTPDFYAPHVPTRVGLWTVSRLASAFVGAQALGPHVDGPSACRVHSPSLWSLAEEGGCVGQVLPPLHWGQVEKRRETCDGKIRNFFLGPQ